MGNLVQIVRYKAHTEIEPHYHKEMLEICHILKENTVIFCGEIRIRAQLGDDLLCEPREVHGVENNTDEDFQFVVFKINVKDGGIVWVE